MTTSTPDPVAALTAEVAELGERLDEVSVIVGRLVDAGPNPAVPAGPGPVPWIPDVAKDEVAGLLAKLDSWVITQLVPQQPDFAAALSQCWALHPDVVANLVALQESWRAAYCDPSASATAAIEWLDRWAPGVQRRVDQSLRGCRGRGHKAPRTTFGPQD